MEPKNFKIKDFSYDLPEDKIAKFPLAERDLSKLLIFRNGEISEDNYKNIGSYIPENSLLIFNDTKVIHARIIFQNSTGGKIEIFCLEASADYAEPVTAMSQKGKVRWKCLVGRPKRWKDQVIKHSSSEINFTAEKISSDDEGHIIEFNWEPADLTFSEVIEKIGEMPIPPYLKRESSEIDQSRYQTVYAKHKGSVAAPTAGLHFTPAIFDSLNAKNIQRDYVTLHVGAGTFKPVKSDTLQDHAMHAEWIDVKQETIENIIRKISNEQSDGNLIAVGTTSLRTLESLYWMGIKTALNPDSAMSDLEIMQWDVYQIEPSKNAVESLGSLLDWMKRNNLPRLVCKTQLLIAPTYQLKIAEALITNFHQPGSTLLLLVAAVAGEDWKRIYDHALKNDFRFLSYGDGSILFKS